MNGLHSIPLNQGPCNKNILAFNWILNYFTPYPSQQALATRILKNVNTFSGPPFTREQKKLFRDRADSSKEMTCASEIFHKEAALTKYPQNFRFGKKKPIVEDAQ